MWNIFFRVLLGGGSFFLVLFAFFPVLMGFLGFARGRYLWVSSFGTFCTFCDVENLPQLLIPNVVPCSHFLCLRLPFFQFIPILPQPFVSFFFLVPVGLSHCFWLRCAISISSFFISEKNLIVSPNPPSLFYSSILQFSSSSLLQLVQYLEVLVLSLVPSLRWVVFCDVCVRFVAVFSFDFDCSVGPFLGFSFEMQEAY